MNKYQVVNYAEDISARISYLRLEKFSLRAFYHFLNLLFNRSRSQKNWNLDEGMIEYFIYRITETSPERCNPLLHYCNNQDKSEMSETVYKIIQIFLEIDPSLASLYVWNDMMCTEFSNSFKYQILTLINKYDSSLLRNRSWFYDLYEEDETVYLTKILDLIITNNAYIDPRCLFQFKCVDNVKKIVEYLEKDILGLVNIPNEDGNSPLHEIFLGCRNFDILSTVEYLLKKGADPNCKNIDGDTPLHFYIKYNIYSFHPQFFKICDVLIHNGASLNVKNSDNKGILAILQEDYNDSKRIIDNTKKIVKYLVKNGFNLNTPKLGYNTPYPILKVLLDCGMDPNVTDEHDQTILQHLVINMLDYHNNYNQNIIDSIYLLRKYNCNFNRVDRLGNNIFHLFFKEAQFEHHNDLFLILYKLGTKLNVKNNVDKIPLDYASSFDYYYLFQNAILTKNNQLLDELLASLNNEKLQEYLGYFREHNPEDTVSQKIQDYIKMRNDSSMAVLDRNICQDVLKYVVNKYCYP